MVEKQAGYGGDIRPIQLAPGLQQLTDAVDVPALGFHLLQIVEQSRGALLLRSGYREEITAASPPGVDDVGDLVVRVEPEVPGWLDERRVNDRIFDDRIGHGPTPHGC